MSSKNSKEYAAFMKWFEETHPEDFANYGRNIEPPLPGGEAGFSVSNKWEISKEEHERVLELARQFFSTQG